MVISLVATLIFASGTIVLHAAPQEVPLYPGVDAPFQGTVPLLVCRGEVPQVLDPDIYTLVQKRLTPLGILVQDPQEIDCNLLCDYNGKWLACRPGSIVVSMRDQAMTPNHAGQTWLEINHGTVQYGSIMMPEKLYYTGVHDAYAKVLAHEILHWAGYQHVWTPIMPGVHAIPRGNLMNPSLNRAGWSTRGIDATRTVVPG